MSSSEISSLSIPASLSISLTSKSSSSSPKATVWSWLRCFIRLSFVRLEFRTVGSILLSEYNGSSSITVSRFLADSSWVLQAARWATSSVALSMFSSLAMLNLTCQQSEQPIKRKPKKAMAPVRLQISIPMLSAISKLRYMYSGENMRDRAQIQVKRNSNPTIVHFESGSAYTFALKRMPQVIPEVTSKIMTYRAGQSSIWTTTRPKMTLLIMQFRW